MHKIKNTFFLLFFLLIFIYQTSISSEEVQSKPLVLVSIAPYRPFVKAIAGESVDVMVIVPPGSSSHTFEPTPKQMIAASHADLWFSIGESFEDKFSKVASKYSKKMEVVNLREGVELIKIDPTTSHYHCSCQKNFEDIHFWLSPKEVMTQVKTIASALSKKYPENAELYKNNLMDFLKEVEVLDMEIKSLLKDCFGKILFVSHPAYAYFARDYGLIQLSVEVEGKDPTSRQLTDLIKKVENANVKIVFIQPQYSNKGAYLIAKQLNASVVSIDPYSEDFFGNMLTIAKKISHNP